METINLYLTLSIVVLSVKLLLTFKDPWNIVLLFYFFFSLGTVLNFTLGNPIYFGIVPAYIPKATQIFFLAILISSITAFIFRNKSFLEKKGNYQLESLITLNPILIALIIYAILQITRLWIYGDLSKVQKIAVLNPSFHYPYLLLQTFALAFFLIIKRNSFTFTLFLANTGFYFAYCLMTGERDFVFPICSIVIHLLAIRKQRLKNLVAYSLGLFLMIFSAVAIFFLRDPTQQSESIISALFNQGSILFINTNILKFLDTSIEFFNGHTYFNSIVNLVPSFIHKTDFNTVNWFKDMYAAKSTSGYGFALDAEGYLNFGMTGVGLTFFIITFVHRLIYNNIDKQPLFLYYSTFYLSFIMYALRNDSLAFFKGNLYAILFFFFVIFSSRMLISLADKTKEVTS